MKHYKKLLEELKNKSTIGKKVSHREKGRMKRSKPKVFGTIIDEVGSVDIYYEYKYFIQKIKRADDSTIEYRICYYTLDNKKNKVMFVRAPSIISPKCFKKLIQKASKKKGFL